MVRNGDKGFLVLMGKLLCELRGEKVRVQVAGVSIGRFIENFFEVLGRELKCLTARHIFQVADVRKSSLPRVSAAAFFKKLPAANTACGARHPWAAGTA